MKNEPNKKMDEINEVITDNSCNFCGGVLISVPVHASNEPLVVNNGETIYPNQEATSIIIESGGTLRGTCWGVKSLIIEEGGKLSGVIYFDREANNFINRGFISNMGFANGGNLVFENYGTVDSADFRMEVINYNKIKGGVFYNKVQNGTSDNHDNAVIENANLYSLIDNYGTINDVYFEIQDDNHVLNNYGTINNGNFYSNDGQRKGILENYGSINNGTFQFGFVNNYGHINGGTFNTLTVDSLCDSKISGGTFNTKVIGEKESSPSSPAAIISGGTFNQGISCDTMVIGENGVTICDYKADGSDEKYPISISNLSIESGLSSGKLEIKLDGSTGVSPEVELGSISLKDGQKLEIDGDFMIATKDDAKVISGDGTIEFSNADVMDRFLDNYKGKIEGSGVIIDAAGSKEKRLQNTDNSNDKSNENRSTNASKSNDVPSPQVPSPQVLFSYDMMARIGNAKEGDSVIIDGRELGINSYSIYFMKEILKNRKSTIIMKYKYQGVEYEVTIPAGAKLTLKEDIPWYGPLYIASGALGKDVKINITAKK